jgi:hypothetical protein
MEMHHGACFTILTIILTIAILTIFLFCGVGIKLRVSDMAGSAGPLSYTPRTQGTFDFLI